MRKLASIALICFMGCFGFAGQRLAFIVGNGNYKNYADLKNPKNDATDIAKVLEGLGFSTTLMIDRSLEELENGVVEFSEALKADKDSIGLFYYAGHAVQVKGANYLIPVDANIPSEAFLNSKTLSLEAILASLSEAGNDKNIVILDACRDNPFSWSRDLSRGLAVVRAQPAGSVIVYSTRENSVAMDGEGKNSVFAQALMSHLTDDADFDEIIDATAKDLIASTRGAQSPAVYKQSFDKIYLSGEPGAPSEPAAAQSLVQKNPAAKKAKSGTVSDFLANKDNWSGDLDLALFVPVVDVASDYTLTGATICVSKKMNGWFHLAGEIGFLESEYSYSSTNYSYGYTNNAFLIAPGCGFHLRLGFFEPYITFNLGLAFVDDAHYSSSSSTTTTNSGTDVILGGALGFNIIAMRNWLISGRIAPKGTIGDNTAYYASVDLSLGLAYRFSGSK